MKTLTIDLPSMYGDHHVVEVRRLLLEMPGVEDVYASSAFHLAEITYDPERLREDDIRSTLDASGYLGELQVSVEDSTPAPLREGNKNFRFTEAFVSTKGVVSFRRAVENGGKPLWPCPGVGVIKVMEE